MNTRSDQLEEGLVVQTVAQQILWLSLVQETGFTGLKNHGATCSLANFLKSKGTYQVRKKKKKTLTSLFITC